MMSACLPGGQEVLGVDEDALGLLGVRLGER